MKDIKGYEGLYAITKDGKVWSYRTKKFLKPGKSKSGTSYYAVILRKDGNGKYQLIHRAVAEAYIPNPKGKTDVNHKNENIWDNRVENLEWLTHKENINYGTCRQRMGGERKPVYCEELDETYNGLQAAANALGVSRTSIANCCTGRTKTCLGYHLRYLDENR